MLLKIYPRFVMKSICCTVIVILICLAPCSICSLDPYKVLNIPKNADNKQIRSAYKALAKEWHPDKNSSPDAQEKFIEIQEAYNILNDDDKRNNYDEFGNADASPPPRYSQGRGHFHFHNFNFNSDSFDFPHPLSQYAWTSQVLPNSKNTPQLIFIYSSTEIQSIISLQNSWRQLKEEFKKYAITLHTVNHAYTPNLVKNIGVYYVPCIVLVYEESFYKYKGRITAPSVRGFVLSELSSKFVKSVSNESLPGFLEGSLDLDKPSVLLLSRKSEPSLSYILLAFKHHQYLSFGFASLSSEDGVHIADGYQLKTDRPSMLIFKESISQAAITLDTNSVSPDYVDETLTKNRHMTIPRLTSQEKLNEYCPSSKSLHICVIAVVDKTLPLYDEVMHNMREQVSSKRFTDSENSQFIKFVCVDGSKQRAFIASLLSTDEPINTLKIVALERKSEFTGNVIKYPVTFFTSDDFDHRAFKAFVGMIFEESRQYSLQTRVKLAPLWDKNGKPLFQRILKALVESITSLAEWLFGFTEQQLMIGTITMLVLVIPLFSSLMPKSNRTDTSSSRNRYDRHRDDSSDSEAEEEDLYQERPKSHDLDELDHVRFHSYILRPSSKFISVIILNNRTGGDEGLVEEFCDIISLYTRDPRIRAFQLDLSLYLNWYCMLKGTDDVTPDGAHGTVLAVNAAKLWYSTFTCDEPSSEDDKYFDYKRSLINWLDRVCEGQTDRVRVKQWPTFYDKFDALQR